MAKKEKLFQITIHNTVMVMTEDELLDLYETLTDILIKD